MQIVLILLDAKAALEEGRLQQYNKAASRLYKTLSEEEKRELNEQFNKEPTGRMSKREVRATGRKILEDSETCKATNFIAISFYWYSKCACFLCSLKELEDLGYKGFAIAFYKECMELAGNKLTVIINCFNLALIEYLHAVIVSGTELQYF